MSDFLTSFIDDDSDSEKKKSKKTGLFIIDNNDKRPNISEHKKSRDKKDKYVNKDDSVRAIVKLRGGAEEEVIIPRYKKNFASLINRNIILYGPTGSGKSTVIRDLMHFTQKCYPIVFAFAPTNREKHDFDKLIPAPLVFEDFGLKEVTDLYIRQRSTTEIYNNANEPKTLHSLFHRVASSRAKGFLEKLLHYKAKAIKEAEHRCESLSEKKNKRDEINTIFKEKLVHFYKQVINPNAKKLQSMDLSKEEKFALRYRFLNAKVLAIFDDAYTEIMKLLREGRKKGNETIKNFFFRGRHANITHWYGFQDDNKLDTEVRKNAFLSIFTNQQVALSYFNRPANSFSLQEKKRAEAAINVVFDEELMGTKHAKLVYSRLDKYSFQYIISDEHEDKEIKMCSKAVREYCHKIKSKDSNFDMNNPYYQRFADAI